MELRTYCALIWFEAVAVGIGANDSTAEMERASDIAASRSRDGLLVIILFRWFVQMLTSERNKANTGKNERACDARAAAQTFLLVGKPTDPGAGDIRLKKTRMST